MSSARPRSHTLLTPLLLLASSLAAGAVPGAAQGTAPVPQAVPSVAAVRTAAPVVIDGRLDEAAWAAAPAATDFVQRDPDEGKPASERTEIRVLYDDDALYVSARMFDRQPGRIARRLTRRDDDPQGVADYIIIGVDPRHDHLTGASFSVSAAGALSDSVLYNDSSQDNTWDAVWDAAVSTDDRGWTAELRIPFSQLRFESAERQTWGFQAVRYIQRLNEEDWWAPIPKTDSAIISKSGHLTGLVGVRGRRHLDLLPYGTTRGEFSGTVPAGDPFNDGSRVLGGTGLDAKWGITSNLTVDATVNPDFGQVEVDPAVVNLTAFETFYDEKRPFFIEGADIFSRFGRNGASGSMGFNRANPTLFYSRRIGRQPQGSAQGDYVDIPSATTILGAAKLTGRTAGGWSLGVLNAVTGREWARVQNGGIDNRTEVEPLTDYFVARVYRNVGQHAGFGLLATAVSRDLRDPALAARLTGDAYVVGADGHYFLDRSRGWVMNGSLSTSYVTGTAASITRVQQSSARYFQRPDATHLSFDPAARSVSGWDLQFDLNRNSGNFRPNVSVWAVSPGFEANDVGFMTTADRWGSHAAFSWRKPTPDGFSRSRQLTVAKWWTWNFAGDPTREGLYTSGYVTFRNYWEFSGTVHVGRSAYSDRLTRGGPLMWTPGFRVLNGSLATDQRKPVSVSVSGSYEDDRAAGWSGNGTMSLTIRPAPALTIETGPELWRSAAATQYVGTFADPAATATYGSRYVFGGLDQTELSMVTRVNLILSPRMSLQLYAQPLLSVGRYAGFKEAARPRTYDFLRYGVETGSIAYDPASARYTVDPGGGAGSAPFAFANPDFNFKSSRINGVFRWEFRPGSTLYLVWTQQQEDYVRPGRFALGPDLSSLYGAPGDNVVLVKVSYWFSR